MSATPPVDFSGLHDALEQKSKVIEKIIDALAHLPRDHVMTIILSWFSIESLEQVAQALVGTTGDMTEDEAKAHMMDRLFKSANKNGIRITIDWLVKRPNAEFQTSELAQRTANTFWEAR